MANDPESTPEPEIISSETPQNADQTCTESPEPSLAPSVVWRHRGEDLAPAIFDSEARPQPGWTAQEDSDIRLMPDVETRGGAGRWQQILLAQFRENYKALCQSLALIAVGAVAALLVVGFTHRRSPLPAALQGSEKIRQDVPPAKPRVARTRRKPAAPAATQNHNVNSPVPAKTAADLKSPTASADTKIAPGKVNLATARQRVRPKPSNFSNESNLAAEDTVTRYDQAPPAPAPK